MPTDLPVTLAQDASQISPGAQVAIYCAIVGLASLLGGGIAASLHLGHRKLQIALSFVAGTMLGVGVLHLLPHAVIIALEGDSHSGAAMSHGALHSSLDGVMLSAVLGFLAMFLLERFFSRSSAGSARRSASRCTACSRAWRWLRPCSPGSRTARAARSRGSRPSSSSCCTSRSTA